MGAFWKTFDEIAGTSLLFSSTNHHKQTDQRDRTIWIFNQLSWAYCQKIGIMGSMVTSFTICLKQSKSSLNQDVLFWIRFRSCSKQSCVYLPVDWSRFSPTAENLMKELDITTLFVRYRLVSAQHDQEIQHSRHHRYQEYKVGDPILNKGAFFR